jgi:Mg-chelatase subunit ChlD
MRKGEECMRKIILLTVLLLFLPSVLALTVNGNCNDRIVQCEVSIKDLEVCNYSNQTELLFISKTGIGAEWINILPQQINLNPNECKELNTFTVSNCYAEPGTYPYQIIIQNGVTEVLDCELIIEQGHFVEVEIKPETQTVHQCQEAIYEVTLTNKSNIPNQNTEFVSLELFGSAVNWSELSKTQIEVTKGFPEKIELKVKAPCSQDLGEYSIGVKAELFNPGFYSEDTAKYIIAEGQDLIISSEIQGNELIACEEQTQVYFISLKNNGIQNDEYELNLIAPDFVELKENKISVDAGTTKDIELILNKTMNAQKEFDLILEAKSIKFNYETSKKFNIKLMDCYDLSVELIDGKTVVCSEEENKYSFKIKNLKDRKINVDLSVSGIQGSLSDNAIVLNGFEEKNVFFTPSIKELIEKGKAEEEQLNLELVLDTSGSMNEKINEERKIDSAKRAANNFVSSISNVKMALRVFGQGNNSDECIPSELIYELGALDSIKATQKINKLTPQGKTPLAEALINAVNDLKEVNGEKAIVLVSDGKETCEGNIDEASEKAKNAGIKVYTVGFDIDETGKNELKEIAKKTNAEYFDAGNADELIEALQKISRTLKITKAESKNISFTLHAESEFAEALKTTEIKIEDCYNSALLIPELILCKGIPFTDFITINNLGTKTAEFNITGLPSWITVQKNILISAEGKETIPFTANPPENASEKEFTITLKSNELNVSETKPIIYLPFESCNAIDLITLSNEINAEVCEGKQFKLIIENHGMRKQTISLKTNISWVYLIQDKIVLEAGKRTEIDYYVSPPFDLKEAVTPITFTAKTETGFETQTIINLIKTGEAFGLEEINVNLLNNEKTLEITDYSKGQLIEFSIENDSNRLLVIENIEALKYSAEFSLEKNRLNPKETIKAETVISLKETEEETIIIPIKFTTNQGTYVRDIKINTVKEPQTINEPIPVGSGLFSLLGLGGALLGITLLIALIIGAIIYKTQKNKEKEETEEENEAKKTKNKTTKTKKKKTKKTTKNKKKKTKTKNN